jgi:hypothetical protein
MSSLLMFDQLCVERIHHTEKNFCHHVQPHDEDTLLLWSLCNQSCFAPPKTNTLEIFVAVISAVCPI